MEANQIPDALPRQPSRASSRWYIIMIFVLSALEAGAAMAFDFTHWQPIVAINMFPLLALVIAKASTSLDLNKWMESATRMVEAKHRGQ
jgi:hypothetical protein